nr:hypothetical protein [Tanacetum cinerariifolium]
LNPGTTPVTTPSTTTTSITNAQLQAMINEGVNAALATRDATRNSDDSHTSGTGARRPVQAARECSYSEFLKCKPLDFKGTEGVVELTRWFEKMESVFSISNCIASNQTTLKKKMTGKYCPKGEIKKIKTEMWNLKCNYNHEGPYLPKCNNCKRIVHLTKDCRSRPANNNNNNRNNNNLQGNGCFECRAQGHFKKNYPKLKNNDRGNQARNDRAPERVYAVGNAGANPDNVVTGTFLLNDYCALILFDTGADKSFVSTAFSSLININPSTLDCSYDVELANCQIVRKMAPKRRTTRLNPGTTPVTTPSTTTTSITNAQLQAMINEGVNAALAARDTTRNGDDSHTLGTGARRPVQAARECSYSEFVKCNLWTSKWNSYVNTTTPEEAYAMTWTTLKKKMTGKYCPRGEIKKIETKM